MIFIRYVTLCIESGVLWRSGEVGTWELATLLRAGSIPASAYTSRAFAFAPSYEGAFYMRKIWAHGKIIL